MEWAEKRGTALSYIQPGKSQQNAYVERYNRTVRHEWLDQRIIEALRRRRNSPGSGYGPKTTYVVRAKPDSYTTFFHTGSSLAGNMHMFKSPPFNADKDLAVVSTINKQPFMINVPISSPIQNMKELTELLNTEGSNASYAVNNTSGKVLGATCINMAGLETVAYKSSADSMNDIMSGAVAFASQDPIFSIGQYREKRYRILAVSSAERLLAIPDVPTMTESGFPMDQVGWFVTMEPAATPKPIVNKPNGYFNEFLKRDDVKIRRGTERRCLCPYAGTGQGLLQEGNRRLG